jgi:hypothetical protein
LCGDERNEAERAEKDTAYRAARCEFDQQYSLRSHLAADAFNLS